MLFSRYAGSVNLVLEYPFEFGIEIINKARENKNDDRAYSRWLMGYEREMSFSEFKQKLANAVVPEIKNETITEKEILAKVKKILEMR